MLQKLTCISKDTQLTHSDISAGDSTCQNNNYLDIFQHMSYHISFGSQPIRKIPTPLSEQGFLVLAGKFGIVPTVA